MVLTGSEWCLITQSYHTAYSDGGGGDQMVQERKVIIFSIGYLVISYSPQTYISFFFLCKKSWGQPRPGRIHKFSACTDWASF